jgi:hypothetical protein
MTWKFARQSRAAAPRPRKHRPPRFGIELLEDRNAAGSLWGLLGHIPFGPDLLARDAVPAGAEGQRALASFDDALAQRDTAAALLPALLSQPQRSASHGAESGVQPTTTQPAQAPMSPAPSDGAAPLTGPRGGSGGAAGVAALAAQPRVAASPSSRAPAAPTGQTQAAAPRGGRSGVPVAPGVPPTHPRLKRAPSGAFLPGGGTTGGGTIGAFGGGGGGSGSGPIATDDTPAQGQTYVAYQSLPGVSQLDPPRPSALNVAADAGLLFNDLPEVTGDRLSAQLVSAPAHGDVILSDDGSFSYKPVDSYVGTDTFTYRDLDTGTGNFSNTATVQIAVIPQNPVRLTPDDAVLETGADLWPKMHHDTLNTGDAPAMQRVQSRVTDTIAFGSPGIRTFGSTAVGVSYVGSPVIGIGPSSYPAVFMESDTGLQALSLYGAGSWTNTSFSRPAVPYQTVYRAPLLAVSSSNLDPTYVALGNQNGQMLFLNGDDGTVAGSFTPTDDGVSGSAPFHRIAGSPNMEVQSNVQPGPALPDGPAYFDVPLSTLFLFGTDFHQGGGDVNPGPSHGRMYALRPDGTVAWMTLTAGEIHGSPLVTPSNSQIPGNRAQVYIGTAHNDWTGHPGQFGSAAGRFYKMDFLTGKVEAENFSDGLDIVHSATVIPGMTNGQVDYESPDTRIFVTSTAGRVMAFQPTIVAPTGLVESPSLQPAWEKVTNATPTSPALSIDAIDTRMIYVGMDQQVLALNADTGATVWSVGFSGKETGSVSVAWDPLRTAADPQHQLQWEVVFGVVGTSSFVVGVDGRSGTVIDQSDAFLDRGFTSAPAIGFPQVGQAGLQASIFVTTDHGQLMWMG